MEQARARCGLPTGFEGGVWFGANRVKARPQCCTPVVKNERRVIRVGRVHDRCTWGASLGWHGMMGICYASVGARVVV